MSVRDWIYLPFEGGAVMVLTKDTLKTEPPTTHHARPRRRWPRIAAIISLVLVVACIAALGGTGWYFSSQAMALVPDRLSYSQRVLAFTGDTVTITRTVNTIRPGTYRLQWRGGQAMLGTIVAQNTRGVTRNVSGNTTGLTVGTPVHFDGFIYSSPAALGLPYRTVKVPDPLGPMPAWFIPGTSTTWVVAVHGRGEPRMEALRPLSTLAGLGLPVLDISYRNDIGAPASSDRQYHFGATEWQDLQASVRYARAHGAQRLILYGFSFGGSIVESFLHRSPDASMVRAAVLDSPALDWSAIFTYRAPGYLPEPVVLVGKQILAWRLGLSNLDQINEVVPSVNYKVKTLVFQGTGDTSVPPNRNIQLARMRPNQVTLVTFPGAEHTQEWNNNPARYTTALRRFLRGVIHP